MKSFKGLLNRTKSVSLRNSRASTQYNFQDAPIDSPEANAQHAIRQFCDSGSANDGGEEVLHLPVIVESAESSPVAAAAAAHQIRKFLSKEYVTKPHVQYNAIMLIRILSDNPGATFTRNFDKSFVSTVKDLLKNGKDPNTLQILRETLDALEAEKSYDQGLQPLLEMWRAQKGHVASFPPIAGRVQSAYPMGSEQPRERGSSRRHREERRLPSAVELASRVEEAKNTAKILLQLVQSTPAEEVLGNELIKEFSERCQSAQRSMQNFINADNPSPDHDTMQTLIETNEQLSLAMSRYQRSILSARRALGASATPPLQNEPQTESNGFGAFAAPTEPQNNIYIPTPFARNDGYGASEDHNTRQTYQGYQAPPGPPPGLTSNPAPAPVQAYTLPQQQQSNNPFADPEDQPAPHGAFQAPPAPSHQRQQPSQTFHIDSEPTFASLPRQNTHDLENAYTLNSQQQQAFPQVSPMENRGSIPSDDVVSPASPQRPGAGAWHQGDVTQSYVGRQASAANGLTMHGGR